MALPTGDIEQLIRSLSQGAEEAADLAELLASAMRNVYRDTLRAELVRHGSVADPRLSPVLEDAIREEAEAHARSIINTHNLELAELVGSLDTNDPVEVVHLVEEWSLHRASWKGPQVAVTAAYTAHADALAGFYAQNGGTGMLFDFGGHGDAAPACAVCAALVARNPHPLSRVLEVGVPHVACAQDWHPLGLLPMPSDLLTAGLAPGGIFGSEPLTQRSGGKAQAVNEIERMP